MSIPKSSFKKIALAAARAGDSKKARPVKVYDLAGKSPLADYAVLMGAESGPHLEAVDEEVSKQLKAEGVYCLHRDGMRSKNWKVLDYGGVLVHVYDQKASEFYAIEKVYENYKPVEWEEKPEAPAPAPKAAKPAAKAAAKKDPAKKTAAKPAKKATAKKAAVKKAVKKTTKKAAKRTAAPARKNAAKKAPKKAVKKAAPKKAAAKESKAGKGARKSAR